MRKLISRILFLSFAALLCLITVTLAGASFYGGLAIPQLTFAEDDTPDRNGFANLGYFAGVEYSGPLTIPFISVCGGASLLYHPLDKKRLDDVVPFDSLTGGDYFTIPLLVGGKVSVPFAGTELFGLAQAGIGLIYRSDLSGNQKLTHIAMTTEYEPAITFAYAFGGGIDFNGNFKVSVRYLNLGMPEFQFDRTLNGSTNSTSGTVAFDTSCLLVALEVEM